MKLFSVLIMINVFITLNSQVYSQTHKYSSYEEVDKIADDYIEEERYDEAISVLTDALEQLPDNQYELTQSLAYIYQTTEDYEKCIEIWEYGIQKGFFYLILPDRPSYKPFLEFDKFKEIVDICRQRRTDAIAKSKIIYELSIPENYSTDKKYPILIAMHGGNSTLNDTKEYWNSTKLLNEYIVVYVQSYLHYGMKRFGWRGYDPRAREDIKNIYSEIISQYSVDTTRVITGGMSAGAMTAIDLVINNVIPSRGFIAVCPVLPSRFDVERAKGAKLLNKRGIIIGGEKDPYMEDVKQIENILKEAEFPFTITLIPDMGHEFPEDFTKRLDIALDNMFKENW